MFQTGTLDTLIALSEELPKIETYFIATVAKAVDTLRSLLNNDPVKLTQHMLVDERTVDNYILNGWKWNEGRYGIQKSLRDLVDILNKVRLTPALLYVHGTRHIRIENDIHRQSHESQTQQLQSSQGLTHSDATEETVSMIRIFMETRVHSW